MGAPSPATVEARVWKGERQAEKHLVRVEYESQEEAAASARPASASVEEVLAAIAEVSQGASQFEVWVPQDLTLGGESVPTEVAMAVLLDKVLERGFLPAGFAPEYNGRLCRYRRE